MSDTNTTSFDARIVLRERNLDETIDLTLSYLRSAFKDFVRPILLSSGSALAVTLTLGLWLDLHWGQRIALAIFATSVSERMITVHAGQHLFRNHGSIAMTAKTVLRHLPAVLAYTFVATLALWPMLLTNFEDQLWIWLGASFSLLWFFAMATKIHSLEILLLEHVPLSRVFRRANLLLHDHFPRAIGLCVTLIVLRGLIILLVFSLTMFLMGFVLQFEGVFKGLLQWTLLCGYILSGPYIAVLRLFDYVDARTRQEGWDIQVRFHAIAQHAREERRLRFLP